MNQYQTLLQMLLDTDIRIDKLQARLKAGEALLQTKLDEARNSRQLLTERLENARRCR